MGDLIPLHKEKDERTAHIVGTAICLDCQNKWTAVAPIGSTVLECPDCGTQKGKFFYEVIRQDREHWECSCGNDLFYITKDGSYCPNCGLLVDTGIL